MQKVYARKSVAEREQVSFFDAQGNGEKFGGFFLKKGIIINKIN